MDGMAENKKGDEAFKNNEQRSDVGAGNLGQGTSSAVPGNFGQGASSIGPGSKDFANQGQWTLQQRNNPNLQVVICKRLQSNIFLFKFNESPSWWKCFGIRGKAFSDIHNQVTFFITMPFHMVLFRFKLEIAFDHFYMCWKAHYCVGIIL